MQNQNQLLWRPLCLSYSNSDIGNLTDHAYRMPTLKDGPHLGKLI